MLALSKIVQILDAGKCWSGSKEEIQNGRGRSEERADE